MVEVMRILRQVVKTSLCLQMTWCCHTLHLTTAVPTAMTRVEVFENGIVVFNLLHPQPVSLGHQFTIFLLCLFIQTIPLCQCCIRRHRPHVWRFHHRKTVRWVGIRSLRLHRQSSQCQRHSQINLFHLFFLQFIESATKIQQFIRHLQIFPQLFSR